MFVLLLERLKGENMTEDEALCKILQIASDNNIKIEHRFADSIFDVYEAEYDLCTKEKK